MPSPRDLIDAGTGQKFNSTELQVGSALAAGVSSVNPGLAITITGPAANPVVNNNGVRTLANGPGISITGTANNPVVNNTAPGPTFGAATRVPFMNAGGTDFAYSAGLRYDDTTSGLLQTLAASYHAFGNGPLATAGDVRADDTFAVIGRAGGQDRAVLDYTVNTVTLGDGTFGLNGINVIRSLALATNLMSANDLGGNFAVISMGTSDLGIGYAVRAGWQHLFTGQITWLSGGLTVGFERNRGGGATTLHLGQKPTDPAIGTVDATYTGNPLEVHSGDLEAGAVPAITVTGGKTTFRGAKVTAAVGHATSTYQGGEACLQGGTVTSPAGTELGGDTRVAVGVGADGNGDLLVDAAVNAAASAGAGAAVPATVEEFLEVIVNGNVRRIPLFLA